MATVQIDNQAKEFQSQEEKEVGQAKVVVQMHIENQAELEAF
jgi:hypothetical protein